MPTPSHNPYPVNSRRQFLLKAPIGILGAIVACRSNEQAAGTRPATGAAGTAGAAGAPPGAPPAFNTAPPVGPEVSPATFAEAEKLMQVSMTDAERQMAAGSWRTSMAALVERRVGPRKVQLAATLAPATVWNPDIGGQPTGPTRDKFARSATNPGPLPASDEDIAFAPVTQLSGWIETRKITSDRLTRIYLDRLT
ncbi:MAG TPA: hypothetical protein VLI40_07370, partial [Gemmatimonadaceae bacterium]|nr:hypothetical protein [Gemmatimonadaceae bacterium]